MLGICDCRLRDLSVATQNDIGRIIVCHSDCGKVNRFQIKPLNEWPPTVTQIKESFSGGVDDVIRLAYAIYDSGQRMVYVLCNEQICDDVVFKVFDEYLRNNRIISGSIKPDELITELKANSLPKHRVEKVVKRLTSNGFTGWIIAESKTSSAKCDKYECVNIMEGTCLWEFMNHVPTDRDKLKAALYSLKLSAVNGGSFDCQIIIDRFVMQEFSDGSVGDETMWADHLSDVINISTVYKRCVTGMVARYLNICPKKFINMKNSNGHSLLMVAINAGKYEMCELLMREGIDLGIKDNEGAIALHHACSYIVILELLLKESLLAGVSIDVKDDLGRTPLVRSARAGVENFKFLVSRGALIDETNRAAIIEAVRESIARGRIYFDEVMIFASILGIAWTDLFNNPGNAHTISDSIGRHLFDDHPERLLELNSGFDILGTTNGKYPIDLLLVNLSQRSLCVPNLLAIRHMLDNGGKVSELGDLEVTIDEKNVELAREVIERVVMSGATSPRYGKFLMSLALELPSTLEAVLDADVQKLLLMVFPLFGCGGAEYGGAGCEYSTEYLYGSFLDFITPQINIHTTADTHTPTYTQQTPTDALIDSKNV